MDLAPGNSNNTGQERKESRKKIKTQTKRAIFTMFPQQRKATLHFIRKRLSAVNEKLDFVTLSSHMCRTCRPAAGPLTRGRRAPEPAAAPGPGLSPHLTQDASSGMARACPTHNLVCLLVSPMCNTTIVKHKERRLFKSADFNFSAGFTLETTMSF